MDYTNEDIFNTAMSTVEEKREAGFYTGNLSRLATQFADYLWATTGILNQTACMELGGSLAAIASGMAPSAQVEPEETPLEELLMRGFAEADRSWED